MALMQRPSRKAQTFPDASAHPIPLSRPSTDGAELAAVAKVLESGWMAGQGPYGTNTEDGLKQLTGRPDAHAVNQRTTRLQPPRPPRGVRHGGATLMAYLHRRGRQ